jgi:hypothetical protein
MSEKAPIGPPPDNGGKKGKGSQDGGPPHISQAIRDEVAVKLVELNPGIKDRIVKAKADAVLDERYNQVAKALDKLEELEKAFNKYKPDHVIKSESGAVVQTGYTPKLLENRNKAAEVIAVLKAAIEKALGPDADYSKLKEAMDKATAQVNKAPKDEPSESDA